MEEVLAVDGATKRYGDVRALDGVSLSVRSGEVFSLIGPNGAGKTTLVRALTGTTDLDSGAVSVLGERPEATDRSRIGLLPQEFSPPARLTGRELVRYYAGLYDEARPVEEVLNEVGMVHDADRWYERLSGGQRRRLCVASALVNDPEVLFLDEPTTAIDPAGKRDLWRLLEGLAADGTTVFLTTHDMAEAETLSDRVGLLAEGDLVEMGTPSELIADHGGENRLVVESTDGDPGDLAARGYRVSREGRTLTVHGVDTRDIGPAVDALDAAEIGYESLTWTQPTLEDVYIELTGERFERPVVEVDA
jgi:ABC-2 type transport system ATP-binding protein